MSAVADPSRSYRFVARDIESPSGAEQYLRSRDWSDNNYRSTAEIRELYIPRHTNAPGFPLALQIGGDVNERSDVRQGNSVAAGS